MIGAPFRNKRLVTALTVLLAVAWVTTAVMGATALSDKPIYSSDGFFDSFENTSLSQTPETFTETGPGGNFQVDDSATTRPQGGEDIPGGEEGDNYLNAFAADSSPNKIVSNKTFGLGDGTQEFNGSLYYTYAKRNSEADSTVTVLNLTDSSGKTLRFVHRVDTFNFNGGFKIAGDVVTNTGFAEGPGVDITAEQNAGWARMEFEVNSSHATWTIFADSGSPRVVSTPITDTFDNPDDVTVRIDHTDAISGAQPVARMDNITINNVGFSGPVIRGTVTDQDGNAISGVTIDVTGPLNTTVTTDSQGLYATGSLPSGTYTVTTEAPGFTNNSRTVTVQSSNQIVDFQLTEKNSTLDLRVKQFFEHGEVDSYEVINTNVTTGQRTEVSGQATVTSNNTSLLAVDQPATQLLATTNRSRDGFVVVTASYDNKTVNETVFVGNVSMDNFQQLPPWGRFEALVNSNVEGDAGNDSFFILLAAALTGAALRLGSTYLGLAGFQLVIIAGWIIDKTTTGVMLVTLAVVGFVALNLAANIDFGGSRVSGFRDR